MKKCERCEAMKLAHESLKVLCDELRRRQESKPDESIRADQWKRIALAIARSNPIHIGSSSDGKEKFVFFVWEGNNRLIHTWNGKDDWREFPTLETALLAWDEWKQEMKR